MAATVSTALTNATVGAGLLRRALQGTADLRWQAMTVDKDMRAALKGHRGCVVWFTGLSGAGKSTIADLVEQRLNSAGRHTFILDGESSRPTSSVRSMWTLRSTSRKRGTPRAMLTAEQAAAAVIERLHAMNVFNGR